MKKFNTKKLIAGISSIAMLAAAMPVSAQAAETENPNRLYGDANEDGKVNIGDAVAILQYLANSSKYPLTEQGQDNADVYNRGDSITGSDAVSIQKYDAKVIPSLPESWMEGNQPGTDPDPVTETIYIHLNGSSISVDGDSNGYTAVEGSKVTISHSGEYYVDGTLEDGQININVPDEAADPDTVKIFLNGASITGKSAPAILVTNAENTSINLVDGTTNTITDGDTAYLDAAGIASGEAVIEAKDDLTIKGGELGTGILNLTANTQTGISCNNDIKITGGVVNVDTLNTTDKTDGIKGKTSVTIKDGEVNVDAEGDGIKSSKGSVAVSGGTVSVKAGNDAIQAETTIDISGGKVVAGGDRGLTAVGGTNITGGTVVATATDYQIDSTLLSVQNQAAVLLNCIDDASNTDGCWKKANSITAGSVSETFRKKYKYVLISDASIAAGQTYTLTNAGTGTTVTHTNDTADSFAVSNSVTTFEAVNPAGKDGGTTVTPTTDSNTITLSGASITSAAPADAVTVSGSVATITQPGIYDITGSGSEVQIVVDVDKTAYPDAEVELDLNGITLTNTTTSPIYVASCGGECIIVAKNGTESTISDGTSYTNADADQGAIYSKDDLKFKGKGKLTVNGNAADAIVGKDDVKIYNGTLVVNAVDDGIRGKDSVKIGDDAKADGSEIDYSNLSVTVNTKADANGGGDGIKSTNDTDSGKGYVAINGGTVNITSYSDGIQAQQEFIMNGGDLTISTYQGSTYTASGSTTTDPGMQWAPGGPGSQGGFNPGGGGMGGDGNSNKTDISCKGIKAVGIYDEAGTTWQSMGNITINGGTITIDSSDDCIHCGGDMKLVGGSMTLATADDGCHSDHTLTIGTQGGGYDDVKILITKGYEGIEAQQITHNSGSAIVNVTDDAYNAGGGSDGSGSQSGNPWEQGGFGGSSSGNYSLTFNGGFAIANTASGDHDGFDSNGSITINGGIWVTNGNEPFDHESGITVNGGIYIEDSQSNGNYMDSQPNYSVTGSSASQGDRISLVGSDGTVIVSFTAGKSVSTLRAGGSVSGASFKIGGTLSGSTYFIDGQECAYGGTVSGTK